MCMAAAGLSAANRAFVSHLNRELRGPFTPADAAAVAGVEHARAARLLRHLAEQGWVARLQRGLYVAVPLEAEDPEHWAADPWAVAMAAFTPGYVGGWSALHHWDLTDQVFATTVFLTTRPVAHRERAIGGLRFELRHRPETALFGTRRVWRDGTPVSVSDPERSLLDCLDDPSLGGGLRHTVDALTVYAEAPDAAWQRLVEYGDKLGNRTVFKRLGYVAETLGLADDELLQACLARRSAGAGRLDPGRPASGPTSSRWSLRLNAQVGG
jgi:predicted transcriptional regulator of viral defense system